MIGITSKPRATSWIAMLLAVGMLLLFTSCGGELAKGKKAYDKRNYDEAIAHFAADGSEEAQQWALSAETAKKLEGELRQGLQAKRAGTYDESVKHFQKAVELEKEIPHLSKYLKTRMASIKLELVQTVVDLVRKAKQEKRYETIIGMESTINNYIVEGDRYYPEVQEAIAFAKSELKAMKSEERKGDMLLDEGDEKGAMDAWRMALRHAGIQHESRIRNKLYTLQQKVEGGVRGLFDEQLGASRTALEEGNYAASLESANAAIEVTKNNPDITLDAGLAYRYKRLAEENLREQELAAAKALEERERQKAIAEYIKVHGKPLTPTVIDYSQENKITAKGKSSVKKGKVDRWYATAMIDQNAYRKLYVRVPDGFEVIVTRSPDKQDAADDVVTRTFIDKGYIYFIAENFSGGRFYPVVSNPEGKDPKFEIDATLYHELDK